MLLKGAYCVGEHFVDPQMIDILRIFTLNERHILHGTFKKNEKLLYSNGSRKSIWQF